MSFYKRFNERDLSSAHASDKINSDLYMHIKNFYLNGIMLVTGDYTNLYKIFPDLKVEKQDVEYTVLRISQWPHLKAMCLLFCPSQPFKFRYVTEEDDEIILFEYNMLTRQVTVYV